MYVFDGHVVGHNPYLWSMTNQTLLTAANLLPYTFTSEIIPSSKISHNSSLYFEIKLTYFPINYVSCYDGNGALEVVVEVEGRACFMNQTGSPISQQLPVQDKSKNSKMSSNPLLSPSLNFVYGIYLLARDTRSHGQPFLQITKYVPSLLLPLSFLY